jgi:hypothetical protein
MKKLVFFLGLIYAVSLLHGQSTSVTNNNTIIIQGNVYYFKPSTSPSSPLPQVTYSSNWIGNGEWWGEDAARAWASIVDWVVLHCYDKVDLDYYDKNRTNAYINRITATRSGNARRAEIKIYYWLVEKGRRMEDGHPDYQLWKVEF